MYRERLRTKTGCLSCRKRRKKCDDLRPRCTPCQRLKLTCEWESSEANSATQNRPRPDSGLTDQPSDHVAAPESTDPSCSMQRIADHDGIDRRRTQTPSGITKELQTCFDTPPGGKKPSGKSEMRHILILGIFQGWDKVPQAVYSHEIWLRVIILDKFLQLAGQGKAARLAMGQLSLALTQVSNLNPGIDRAKEFLPVPGGAKFGT